MRGFQIEYLVVYYDEKVRDARLSLRQAEILMGLAHDEELQKAGGCVPSLQNTTVCVAFDFNPKWKDWNLRCLSKVYLLIDEIRSRACDIVDRNDSRPSTRSMVGSCSSPLLD